MTLTVLTGDIAKSTTLSPDQFDAALRALADAFADISGWGAPAKMSKHRGDGWQIASEAPNEAFRMALVIRAHLRSISPAIDTRLAISTGSGTLPEAIETTSDATFVLSGQCLDQMKDPIRMSYANGGPLQAVALMIDHISSSWTETQAKTILPFLRSLTPPTQKQVADLFGVSRQSVGKTLDAAAYHLLHEVLHTLEEETVYA